ECGGRSRGAIGTTCELRVGRSDVAHEGPGRGPCGVRGELAVGLEDDAVPVGVDLWIGGVAAGGRAARSRSAVDQSCRAGCEVAQIDVGVAGRRAADQVGCLALKRNTDATAVDRWRAGVVVARDTSGPDAD